MRLSITLAALLLLALWHPTLSEAQECRLRVITGNDPAAGAEIADTVDAGKRWRILAARLSLVTDATASNRRVHLQFADTATVLFNKASSADQTASLTLNYNMAIGGSDRGVTDTDLESGLPDFALGPGYVIQTNTTNLQAGDNYGAPIYLIEERDETTSRYPVTLCSALGSG